MVNNSLVILVEIHWANWRGCGGVEIVQIILVHLPKICETVPF